jgi:hypothetical protein
MSDLSAPQSVFGPVVVLSKKPSSSGSTIAVKLCQVVTTTYPPGTRPHLALQEAINDDHEPKTVVSCRKATQRLLPAEAEKLKPGDEIEGHLVRTLRANPRYTGQKAAYEGGYASSTWSPTFEEDIDLRDEK